MKRLEIEKRKVMFLKNEEMIKIWLGYAEVKIMKFADGTYSILREGKKFYEYVTLSETLKFLEETVYN